MNATPKARRWFWWKPQWFYSWPVKVMRGGDEYGWHTFGIVTWAGSFFIRTGMCTPACKQWDPEYAECWEPWPPVSTGEEQKP